MTDDDGEQVRETFDGASIAGSDELVSIMWSFYNGRLSKLCFAARFGHRFMDDCETWID